MVTIIAAPRPIGAITTMMNQGFDWRDIAIRLGVMLCGAAAAALFVVKGEGSALTPLAIGAMLGVLLASNLSRGEA